MRNITIVLGLSLATASTPLFAYIDPGSGGAILSLIIGSVAVVGFTLKTYWRKITKTVFKRKDVEEDDDKPSD